MLNIFQHLRDLNVDLKNESLIAFEYDEEYNFSSFCNGKTYIPGPPSNLIDGNNKTAWTNNNFDDENSQYFIIDFITRRITVRKFTLGTLCNPPTELFLEGSNTKESWTPLRHVNQTLAEFSLNTFSVSNLRRFRYLRFRQLSATTSYHRFILTSIEIFGTFGVLPTLLNQILPFHFSYLFIVLVC